jgi:DNA ligase 1
MNTSMPFVDLVATSDAVAATRARSRKIDLIADLLKRVDTEELPVAVALLTGEPRQGKIGVGWRTVRRVDVTPATQAALTIDDVDASLDALAGMHGPGSQARRAQVLGDLFGRATSAEQWFLRRLLVGELRQGALAGVVSDAVARSADVPQAAVRRATMLAGDLPQVARVAHRDGLHGLAAVGLTILRPIQPMLAQTATDVVDALDLVGGTASVEWKLDGARIQVHSDARDVRVYTRNLNDVTAQLPEVVALVRSLPAQHVVLDGEAVGWGENERPDLFQDVMSRFSRDHRDRSGEVPLGMLQARFFDILHLDGTDLVDHPLTERLGALEQVAGPWRIKGRLTDDPAVARGVLDEALAHGHEGVMVKAAASLYEAGRRGGAWRKVKPIKTLDLVVLAAEWGSGRRRGWLSNLHLGARDPDAAHGEDQFVMVGKTFKGLTDGLLTWQTERLQELATRTEDHVVHVRPELVVEIALDGVQVSTRYPGGVALRFARVKRYRPDKDPVEADTIEAVRALFPVTP